MKRFSIKSVMQYVIPCVIFAAVMVWLVVSLSNSSFSAKRQELTAVKTTVENGITMCYAIEGAYPPSIDYLREYYGITYDMSRYLIYYDIFADNVRPSIKVIERGAA